ncbi:MULTISPECIES: ABC transporter permease [Actinomyces]|uniref:ABC transporter permease n=1 Tax=Actinomyces TaxID=1654 RepID=UPI00159F640A|nr:ABC transporter permease [Actinomyces oris]
MSLPLLSLEVRRRLRNRRSVIFSIVLPVAFFLMFTTTDYSAMPYGNGNVVANMMIGMALYGALMTTTGAGAAVSTERASGWSRQLRLTPLKPIAYITAKAIVGMLISALAIGAVYACGPVRHAQMPAKVWIFSALIIWLGSLVFVAFGLFVGYLLPSDNAMQVVGPLMALLAFLGGMFIPLTPGSTMDRIGSFTPMYGLHNLALWPMGAESFSWWWVVNVLSWLAVFLGGAAWKMGRDTARV